MADDEELLIVPVPSLIATLVNAQDAKGSPLTEQEVLEIRDNCPCIAMPKPAFEAVEKERGYQDIDPKFVWEQWLDYTNSL